MTQLPWDVLINVLGFLPVVRHRQDISASTLYSCLAVDSLFREAASLPLLWKPHYQIRYRYSNDLSEKGCRQAVEGNWRLMYNRRRELDRAALKLLDRIVLTRVGLQGALTKLVRQSLDVWDVLDLECTCPVPYQHVLSNLETDGNSDDMVPDHAICRRYWAKSIRDAIARGYGLTIWRNFARGADINEFPSFELTMFSLSTVYGVLCNEVWTDDLFIHVFHVLIMQPSNYR